MLKTTDQDHAALANNQSFDIEDNILRLEGLPWNAKEDDVRKFFVGKLNFVPFFLGNNNLLFECIFESFASERNLFGAGESNESYIGGVCAICIRRRLRYGIEAQLAFDGNSVRRLQHHMSFESLFTFVSFQTCENIPQLGKTNETANTG